MIIAGRSVDDDIYIYIYIYIYIIYIYSPFTWLHMSTVGITIHSLTYDRGRDSMSKVGGLGVHEVHCLLSITWYLIDLTN